MIPRAAAWLVGAVLAQCPAAAAEVCRFEGTSNHAGRMVAKTEVTAKEGLVTVNVTVALTARIWWTDVRYLTQEISTWRDDQLQSVAVNARYGAGGRSRRQQWDVFTRGAGGLEARRVQAKTLADFQRRHPGFVSHWAPAAFGQPWLQDYAGAAPERRPDLDLPRPAMPPGLRPPLALAFYWSRWLAPGGETVPAFLPGFKRHARTDLAFGAATSGEGSRQWRASVRHPSLSASPASTASVWVSPDNYLLQLAFDVHSPQGSAQGLIHSQGCQGIAVPPARSAR